MLKLLLDCYIGGGFLSDKKKTRTPQKSNTNNKKNPKTKSQVAATLTGTEDESERFMSGIQEISDIIG